jgi:integrase/recombinase XerD
LTFNDIEGAHYDACPLGHDKLDTTARYTRVATGMIANVESPLDLLSQPRKKPRKHREDPPPA